MWQTVRQCINGGYQYVDGDNGHHGSNDLDDGGGDDGGGVGVGGSNDDGHKG